MHAVEVARGQFFDYRRQHPDWAADNAPRTLASLIHDWMWTDLKQQLDGLPHVNLIDRHSTRQIAVRVQYEWDKETRTMGDAVISLRDGHNKIIWVHSLVAQGEAGGGTVTRLITPGPTLPTLDVLAVESDDPTGTEET
ncbi:MAG: hypothetical protein ACRDSR_18560 [Pseudonocardiaceae bacterium]